MMRKNRVAEPKCQPVGCAPLVSLGFLTPSKAKKGQAEKNDKFKGGFEILLGILIILVIFYFKDQTAFLKEFGYLGVFVISMLSAATIFLPAPGWAIVFGMASVLNPIYVGLVAGIGSGIGEMTGYVIGRGVKNASDAQDKFKGWKDWIKSNDVIAITVLAFIPNPLFDVAGLAAGAFEVPWWKFLLSCVLGRVLRYVLLAYFGAFSIQYL